MGLLSVRAATPTHFTGSHASPEMIFLYGETFTVNGAPAQPGDEVAVYSASGVLCGAAAIAGICGG